MWPVSGPGHKPFNAVVWGIMPINFALIWPSLLTALVCLIDASKVRRLCAMITEGGGLTEGWEGLANVRNSKYGKSL